MNAIYCILLLVCSNIFMTIAWYGHLKFKEAPLVLVIFASWGIALFEYMLQVPANRIGSNALTPYQLKIAQEAITLAVFVIFAALYFGDGLTWRYGLSMVLMLCAVAVAFYK